MSTINYYSFDCPTSDFLHHNCLLVFSFTSDQKRRIVTNFDSDIPVVTKITKSQKSGGPRVKMAKIRIEKIPDSMCALCTSHCSKTS